MVGESLLIFTIDKEIAIGKLMKRKPNPIPTVDEI
jgi:hypothetical protein